MPILQGKMTGDNLPCNPVALSPNRARICAITSPTKGSVARRVTKQMFSLPNLAAWPGDNPTAGRATNLKSASDFNSGPLNQFIDSLSAYSRYLSQLNHGNQTLRVSLHYVNLLFIRQPGHHHPPIWDTDSLHNDRIVVKMHGNDKIYYQTIYPSDQAGTPIEGVPPYGAFPGGLAAACFSTSSSVLPCQKLLIVKKSYPRNFS